MRKTLNKIKPKKALLKKKVDELTCKTCGGQHSVLKAVMVTTVIWVGIFTIWGPKVPSYEDELATLQQLNTIEANVIRAVYELDRDTLVPDYLEEDFSI